MRSSRCLSLGGAVILVLVLSTAMLEAEATRLDAETRASVSSTSQMAIIDNPNEAAGKGPGSSISETKRSVDIAAKEVRAVAHKLPEFHEDYYGPSDHGPRHH